MPIQYIIPIIAVVGCVIQCVVKPLASAMGI